MWDYDLPLFVFPFSFLLFSFLSLPFLFPSSRGARKGTRGASRNLTLGFFFEFLRFLRILERISGEVFETVFQNSGHRVDSSL